MFHLGSNDPRPRRDLPLASNQGPPWGPVAEAAMNRLIASIAVCFVVAACSVTSNFPDESPTPTTSPTSSAATALLPSGRQLTPVGTQVELGNFPTGGAATSDGRYLWTVSAGMGGNDVRIVDTTTHAVCQTLTVPGASGGIALDSAHHLAYVSGLPDSRWLPTDSSLPGATGDVVHVFAWTDTCGQATEQRVIPVPPQPNAPTSQAFPPPRQGLTASTLAWPQKLAVSPDGSRLLVPLNLANSAAIVDLSAQDQVRYATAGSYPFGAAITPDGRTGLVTNEAAGTLSVIDLASGRTETSLAVGAPLSHPQGVVVDATGTRAYVAISASDQVAVVDLADRTVERTLAVGRSAGLGTMPVAVSLDPTGSRLFVAESGADEIAVIRVPGGSTTAATAWQEVGRIPTSDQPQAVVTTPAHGSSPAQLMYVAAEGLGVGPNPLGPNPTLPTDPIFWAFNSVAPTTDVFSGVQYTPTMVTGRAGLLALPTDAQVAAVTPAADRQLIPTNSQPAPADTPLRAHGSIQHVFFLVRENRSYDQLLGDDSRGNGDPTLTVFGQSATPNLHSLVDRFPLLDNVMANSEVSIQGHYWTSAASVPDYVTRNWVAQYAGRGRPNDFGTYAVTWPGNGYLFDQAERQGISYFNYGEAFAGGYTSVADRDRTPAIYALDAKVEAHSDLGPPFTGCYASDMSIGNSMPTSTAPQGSHIFDSSLPSGATAGSFSHVDCFRQRFAAQLASGSVPALNYLSLTSDHTRGTQPGFPTPTAMVADSDLAIGQLVDTISHSSVWSSSLIVIVEDDSQDGADHVDAHRIPVAVISPYAKQGAVIHTRYDLLSAVRSIELVLGMKPLSLNDALATPMYDVFTATPDNGAPVSAVPATLSLLTPNPAAGPDSEWSTSLALGTPDQVAQRDLDAILWHSVHGAASVPPPPGPGASAEDDSAHTVTAASGDRAGTATE